MATKEKRKDMMDNLFIKEIIRKVHEELIKSEEEREEKGLPILFTVKDLTVEVNFVAEKSTKMDGGLDFKIVTIGADRNLQSQQIHKITLNLTVEKEQKTNRFDNINKGVSPNSGRFPKLVNGKNPLMQNRQESV